MRPKTRNHAKHANKKRNAKSYAKGNTTEKKTQKTYYQKKQNNAKRITEVNTQKKEHHNANQN